MHRDEHVPVLLVHVLELGHQRHVGCTPKEVGGRGGRLRILFVIRRWSARAGRGGSRLVVVALKLQRQQARVVRHTRSGEAGKLRCRRTRSGGNPRHRSQAVRVTATKEAQRAGKHTLPCEQGYRCHDYADSVQILTRNLISSDSIGACRQALSGVPVSGGFRDGSSLLGLNRD